jgi:hypothetical protein
MRISVIMLGTAFPINEALRSMQVPGILLSHARAIGVHWKMLTRIMAIAQAIETPPKTEEAIRISLVGKIRVYISRMEVLVTAMVVT